MLHIVKLKFARNFSHRGNLSAKLEIERDDEIFAKFNLVTHNECYQVPTVGATTTSDM